jgi:DNA polymerase III subunit epsilon
MNPAGPPTRTAAPIPATAADLRFAVVDVETSGLSSRWHRVLQVGVVVINGEGTVLDSWSSLVRPRWRRAFRLGPRHIHGLTRASLRGAPREREVMAELATRLQGTVFTAHNAKFDADFLRRSAQRTRQQLPLSPQLDTLWLSRRLDPERELSHRLGDVCARYGIANERPHDALEDALATAALLPHLLRAHGIDSADRLADFTWPRRQRADAA